MNRGRRIALGLGIVIAAVLLQTTVFAPGRVQPLGVAPNLVLLAVIAVARHLEPEPAIVVGFTAGLLVDLLGASPLGVWGMVLTVVAYLTVRLRHRAVEGPVVIGLGVVGLVVVGQALFVVVGTLFGMGVVQDPGIVRRTVLPAVYDLALAGAVLPAVTAVLRPRRRSWLR